jgi:hypothetical protein
MALALHTVVMDAGKQKPAAQAKTQMLPGGAMLVPGASTASAICLDGTADGAAASSTVRADDSAARGGTGAGDIGAASAGSVHVLVVMICCWFGCYW